jgi:hypothetical protein
MVEAEESGLPRYTVFLIETGRQIPTPEQELAIKKALSRILRKRAANFRSLLAEESVQQPQPDQQLQP